jgi:hypothetical protein
LASPLIFFHRGSYNNNGLRELSYTTSYCLHLHGESEPWKQSAELSLWPWTWRRHISLKCQ